MEFTKDQLKKDSSRFGGNTLKVYKRDKYQCRSCGMTMQEHIDKYGRRLTINHKDGTGRDKSSGNNGNRMHAKPNHSLSNLETLCLKCHGIVDGNRTTSNQHGRFKRT